ncbi:MAG: hypothetical protein IJJ73_02995 [Bacteroidaceae bacterium]|nr:hypothetical protein [Bacteroidaceae bacterium]
MKKFFAMAAVAAMFLTACTGNKIAEDLDFEKATPEAVVSALAEKVQAGDATAINAALETVQTQLSKLVDAGNIEKVSQYAAKIKAFVEENAEALKNFNIDVTPLTKVIDQVAALPGAAVDEAQSAAEDAVEGAVDEAQGAVEGAVDAVEGAVNDAVEAGKAAVEDAKAQANKAVEDAKAQANKAVEEGKAKTNEAIQNAADKIKL